LDLRRDTVEIVIRHDGQVIWVNTKEGCVCRISGIKELILEDRRTIAEKRLNAALEAMKKIATEKDEKHKNALMFQFCKQMKLFCELIGEDDYARQFDTFSKLYRKTGKITATKPDPSVRATLEKKPRRAK